MGGRSACPMLTGDAVRRNAERCRAKTAAPPNASPDYDDLKSLRHTESAVLVCFNVPPRSPLEQPLILIVDDFPDALEIYQSYLTFKGYRVITATSGAEAISLVRDQRPALIFMDLQMAEMTGTTAMLQIRADAIGDAAAPIIALTAHALDEQRVAALVAGFDEVIPKPCLPDQLATAIDRLLARPVV
jgi:CheY-like chemotaxis protein